MNRLLSILLLCAATHTARANYLFTWEGDSNLFNATFEVTGAEAQPGQNYYPSSYPLSLTNSISIGSPDGNTFRWGYTSAAEGQDQFGMLGSGPPMAFIIYLYEPGSSPWDALEVYANPSSIEEIGWQSGSPTVLYGENGEWNITYIPEPSAVAVLGLGAVAWFAKRKRLLSLFGRR